MPQDRAPAGIPTGGEWTTTRRAESGVRLDAASEEWPAVRVEERPWRTNPDQTGPSGARPNQADRLLDRVHVEIPAPIADRNPVLAPETLTRCEDAARRVSGLEADSQHLSGLGDLLIRTEALASSRIEHIYADLDEIARAAVGEAAGEQARRTVAAGQALSDLTRSCDHGSPLTENAVLAAHRALLHDDLLNKAWAGRYREQQNWIGGSDFSPRTAAHVPPPHDHVEPLMADLTTFANRDDVPALVQAAIVHAQFEAIHPFTDGNGRVGRGLISAVLRRRGVTEHVVVPIAAAMLTDVDTYFDRLKDYREGNLDPLVHYMADSAEHAAAASRESAHRLADLPETWHEKVGARRGSSTRTLIDGLVINPVLDIARAEAVTGSSRARTYEALDRLVDAGVLEEITRQARHRVWVAQDVMTELSELEEAIGVRSTPSRRWR
jgi:Fic family protein